MSVFLKKIVGQTEADNGEPKKTFGLAMFRKGMLEKVRERPSSPPVTLAKATGQKVTHLIESKIDQGETGTVALTMTGPRITHTRSPRIPARMATRGLGVAYPPVGRPHKHRTEKELWQKRACHVSVKEVESRGQRYRR